MAIIAMKNLNLRQVSYNQGDVVDPARFTSGEWANANVEGALADSVLLAGGLSSAIATMHSRVYTPEAYGAATSYNVTVDDTAAVQAAITAAQTAKGVVRLTRVYNIPSGGLVVTSPVTIVGTGGVLKGGITPASGFTSDHATAVGLTVQASGVTLRDFAIVNTHATAPTAGSGLFVDGSASFTWGDLCIYDHVDTVGWYDNVKITAGSYWKYTNCYNYNAANHGLLINNPNNPDGGDQFITNNAILTLLTSAGAGIKWESGGGPKIIGNKINGGAPAGFAYGIHINPQTSLTSVVLIEGNSIENTRTNSIRFASSSNALTKMICTGNQCSMYSPTGGPTGVIVVDGNGQLSYLIISNNVTYGDTPILYGIWIDGVGTTKVKDNVCERTQGGLFLGANNAGVDAEPPMIVGTTTIIRDNVPRGTSTNSGLGFIDHRYSRQIPATGKASAVTLYSCQFATNDNAVVKITLNGAISGVGDFIIQATRGFYRHTAGVCTVATIGTDLVEGTAAADVLVTFDAATVTGEVRVNLQLASGSVGTNIYGRATMEIVGGPTMVKRGAATTPA